MRDLKELRIVIWNLWTKHHRHKKAPVSPLLWMRGLYIMKLWGEKKNVGYMD
ncbi:hypothetical protein DsansV1_C17g0144351 [Dioscorea sansibarensis]